VGTIEVVSVVIDTNVFVSALLFGGTPGKLIPLWKSKKILPHLSSEILTELLRVLAYPKFKLTESEIQYLLYVEILPFCSVVETKTGSVIIERDPSDDMFLRCCEAVDARALISGDNHLLKLKRYRHTLILTPSQFLKEFRYSDLTG
jgi:putative PIN family toxin of toxin-antitoxin system